ncbi:hypothetical protein N7481_009146 [Penicillium waksmanii]|uniref:uncharacterized protein n=1 Tax=Penicillium waksmanii TaxID=69791 RepID=UPI0025499F04|nr:uncharacterized protein N7481_009146 [Penicillium waksmanii]KAJ5975439.1 hypothetical protein N7481_009146 [Penicillium waksmanii]
MQQLAALNTSLGGGSQDIVTWDKHSIMVRGQRVMFFSGEFHPFRLPAPGLWLDVFQKIKAMGFNGVSFYVNWALLEGKEGDFTAEGVFALEPFFDAAKTAGIYLLARPGPYINAEVSGGGFPGWLARLPTGLRTRNSTYMDATQNYVSSIGGIIAKAQITNGGPVILVQPENEYSSGDPPFPDPVYFRAVEQQYRDAGIVVPFISNDNSPHGYFYDQGPPEWPIYGHDSYPMGFNDDISEWPVDALPTNYGDLHEEMAPNTPYSVIECQGGSWDPWGGYGYNKTAARQGPEYQRVFFKNFYSFGVTVFNVYMGVGGTNWGNMGYPEGYTSYDYGAPITEMRTVERENFSELKLQAMFLQSSPAYATAIPQNNTHASGSYTGDVNIATTAVLGNRTSFFVLRHADYTDTSTARYHVTLPTSKGNITIPQLGGSLSLVGRDSKLHVTDYNVGGINLLYSTAEIFTWRNFGSHHVLVVYGGPGETHELGIQGGGTTRIVEGGRNSVKFGKKQDSTIMQYTASDQRTIVELSNGLYVYLLDRYSAYNYWSMDLPSDPVSGNYTNTTTFLSSPIVKAGYLVRSIKTTDKTINLMGDFNSTTEIEIIGADNGTSTLVVNNEPTEFQQDSHGVIKATVNFKRPNISLPVLSEIGWKVLDTLPEIQKEYDDSHWMKASLSSSNNTERNLSTPMSLYASDYGFHSGYILYRTRFTSNGEESLYLETQGGSAYGHSVWLNETFLGSFSGGITAYSWNQTFGLPAKKGQSYTITVLIDQMGYEENGSAGSSDMKTPRGILNYSLSGFKQSDLSWKITGNLGGESYSDRIRGPLNEGGLFAERQGYHLPGAPILSWNDSNLGPMEGLSEPGVAFYATTFKLDMPTGYDIPISLSFANNTDTTSSIRCQVYVNGYQFGKWIHNIGPQDIFPVPEGIWDYHGENHLGVSLWALEKGGGKVENLELIAGPVVQSSYPGRSK